MIARVERISRVNGTSKDISAYGQRQGYAEDNGGHAFERELNSALRQKTQIRQENKAVVEQPYILSVTRATQSLFYENGIPVARLGKYLNGI